MIWIFVKKVKSVPMADMDKFKNLTNQLERTIWICSLITVLERISNWHHKMICFSCFCQRQTTNFSKRVSLLLHQKSIFVNFFRSKLSSSGCNGSRRSSIIVGSWTTSLNLWTRVPAAVVVVLNLGCSCLEDKAKRNRFGKLRNRLLRLLLLNPPGLADQK